MFLFFGIMHMMFIMMIICTLKRCFCLSRLFMIALGPTNCESTYYMVLHMSGP
jgi:hypothetical protein